MKLLAVHPRLCFGGPFVLMLAVLPLDAAAEPRAARTGALEVSRITLQLFSQADGSVRPFDKPPNPYGMDIQVLAVVEVRGQLGDADPPARLDLRVDAAGWEDEATGAHERWRTAQRLSFRATAPADDEAEAQHRAPRSRHLAFLLPWTDCYPEVRLDATVRWGKRSHAKSIKTSFSCAE